MLETFLQAMADWLEEDDQPLRAEFARLRKADALDRGGRPARQ